MKKLYESFIKRRGMRSIPQYRIKRGVAKPLRKVYQKPSRCFTSHTRMPAGIRGYRIKQGIGKPLRKVYQKPLRRFTSHTRMPAGIRGYQIDTR